MVGTIINVGTVSAGTALGVALGASLPERVRETVMHALGLVVLVIGVDAGLEAFRPPLSTLTRASVVVVMASVLIGGVIGELLRIEDALDRAGEALKRRFGAGQTRFTEGFVVASLVFCVGPLTIIGAIEEGVGGDYQTLAVKALLDGFAALGFASVLGVGVGFSIVTILVYQGGLTLAASSVAGHLTDATIAAITAAGGVLILGIALRLLSLREVRVANLLPALVIAPVTIAVIEAAK